MNTDVVVVSHSASCNEKFDCKFGESDFYDRAFAGLNTKDRPYKH